MRRKLLMVRRATRSPPRGWNISWNHTAVSCGHSYGKKVQVGKVTGLSAHHSWSCCFQRKWLFSFVSYGLLRCI